MTETGSAERTGKLEKQNRRLRQVAVLSVLFIALIAVMGESGCPSDQPNQTSTPAPANVRPYQRFRILPHTMDWALDTKTGQLCRTWDWTDANIEKAKAKGGLSKLQGMEAAAVSTPLCEYLWTEYPDSGQGKDFLAGATGIK